MDSSEDNEGLAFDGVNVDRYEENEGFTVKRLRVDDAEDREGLAADELNVNCVEDGRDLKVDRLDVEGPQDREGFSVEELSAVKLKAWKAHLWLLRKILEPEFSLLLTASFS